MTAILDDIRRLDAAHARGEISALDLAAAKADLIASVPEASEAEHNTPQTAERQRRAGVMQTLLLCVFVLTLCAGATILITGDLMLAMTLSITVLAALTVTLFRQLDG